MRYSVDNLCYQLLQGEVCLEPLRVLALREIAWQDGRVVFFVLGASHAVFIETPDFCVTELLTCAPLILPTALLAQSGVYSPVELQGDLCGLQYCTALRPYALEEGDALRCVFLPANTLTAAYPPHAAGKRL